MKDFTPELPKDVLARHKLVAFTALMAIKDYLGEDKVEETEVVGHTSNKRARSLIKELQSLGLKVVAYCNGRKCHWSADGLDMEGSADKELDIDPKDTYFLDSDVVILDEVNEYIDLEDSKSFNSSILIETGNYITQDAKRALEARNIVVIPHQFFNLYPLENAETKNVKTYAEGIREVWEEVSTYAKNKKISFDSAFEYVKSQDIV